MFAGFRSTLLRKLSRKPRPAPNVKENEVQDKPRISQLRPRLAYAGEFARASHPENCFNRWKPENFKTVYG